MIITFFLKSEDTVKELIVEFLKIILGKNCALSKDYDAKIIFQWTNQLPEINILTLFLKKKENNVMFALRQQLKKF